MLDAVGQLGSKRLNDESHLHRTWSLLRSEWPEQANLWHVPTIPSRQSLPQFFLLHLSQQLLTLVAKRKSNFHQQWLFLQYGNVFFCYFFQSTGLRVKSLESRPMAACRTWKCWLHVIDVRTRARCWSSQTRHWSSIVYRFFWSHCLSLFLCLLNFSSCLSLLNYLERVAESRSYI